MNKDIQSLQNPLVKHLVKLRQDRAYRHQHRTVVVEGIKPVTELCKFIKPLVLLSNQPYPNSIVVDDAILRKVSGMENPEGLLAEFPMPAESNLLNMQNIMVLDGVSDPGNMGTLLRTALALGWDGAFILNKCCDPYNDKAIRAARGATFRLPLKNGSWNDLKEIADKNRLEMFVADLEGKTPEECQSLSPKLLVFGNEAKGPSSEILAHCQKVTIPMPGNMESLNVAVAGGILLYLLRKPTNL